MKETYKHSIILIPSFEPDNKLPTYIKELNEYGVFNIVIVDDGSDESYGPIFRTLEGMGCIVLKHYKNLGKGSALKTGYKFIKENITDYSCVVTVDSDGQHAAKDVYNVIKKAGEYPDALILGERNFKKYGVPIKSFIGNRVTSAIFALLYGKYFQDTQTGLRAFGSQLIDQMIEIKGSRFEYEIQVLITCIHLKTPIYTISIQTIYENDNKGTHFNSVTDSLRILKMIMADFIKFFSSSMTCAVIDISIAWLLFESLKPFFVGKDFLRIISATVIARCISIYVNYLLNKNLVFKDKQAGGRGLFRYLVLCVLIMFLSGVSVYSLHTIFLLNEKKLKVLCDVCLFFLSYQIQRRWVFQE